MMPRFVRVAETERRSITLLIDGRTVEALEGDTLLTAMLTAIGHVRTSEFGDGSRAGFCLMGACQDCWVWTSAGSRLRACSTFVTSGMSVLTTAPETSWSNMT
ncbi:MAG: (2Fe-2S)-binding protein [Gammaproteobacteria bacterium]|nr:(2Fe-2S)-binding protein [Gammaproteobacteria bacterium]